MKILRPLIRVLLRNGVSCKSFEELVRKAYVDEAFAVGKSNKQKTTVSSVAGQTGLSRKEVKRLYELQVEQCEKTEQKYNRAVKVISGWVNDFCFTNEQGQVKPLEKAAFAVLVKKYSGDITPNAMLKLLLDASCVSVEDDKIHLVTQAYIPGNDSTETLHILGEDASELLTTIDYNLTHENKKRFQRKVSTALLKPDSLDEFTKLSADLSQNILEKLDKWIAGHEVLTPDSEAVYISLGVYFYENEPFKENGND